MPRGDEWGVKDEASQFDVVMGSLTRPLTKRLHFFSTSPGGREGGGDSGADSKLAAFHSSHFGTPGREWVPGVDAVGLDSAHTSELELSA